MTLTLKNTFAKIATLTYCLGTVAHIRILIVKTPADQMPDFVHGTVTILAGYAGLGFWMNIRKINFKNTADKIIYLLVLIHLTVSALLHAYSLLWQTNDWLRLFKPAYSYFAVAYFVAFAYYSFILDRKLKKK